MVVSIERWNGYDINDVTYEAVIDNPSLFTRQGTPVQVQPPGSWSTHIRTEQRARALQFIVKIISGDVNTAQRQLQQWFAPGTEGELEILEDGTAKVIDAVCVGFARYEPFSSAFSVSLVAADPRWRSVNPSSSASLITTSGGSFSFNNVGNSTIDDPVITIRPVANKSVASAWTYRMESVIAWRAARGASNYAIEVTGGGWDHASEVGALHSQADGDDVRVLVDGIEVPRWFGEHANNDANSAATKIWINADFAPRRTAVLLTAMTTASPTEGGEIEVEKGGTLGWPRQGVLRIDNEAILYSGRTENNANGRAAFTGIVRGVRDTTVATHSAATTMYWVEHRVQVVFGSTTGASAPDARADLKPMLDLTSSNVSNERLEWLNFADSAYPGRSMQWLTRSRTFDDQYDKILAPTASPLTALTWEYQSGGAVSGKPIGNTYYIDLPTGTGSSGGNVATITRVLADTLGMWAYGIDDAGQEVVLEKYAGALTSASDNITAPTNPIYRFECWVFNQVIARRPDGPTWTDLPHALTGTPTDNAQQFRVGNDSLDLCAVTLMVADAVGGAQVVTRIYADNTDTPAGSAFNNFATTYTTTAAGTQTALMAPTTPITLQPDTDYWLGWDDTAATTSAYYNNIAYSGGQARRTAGAQPANCWDFRILGRPAPLASAFTRMDENAFGDDGDQVTVDGVTIHLSTSDSPYVALKARKDAYRFVPSTLYNETTGQSVTLNVVCGTGDEIVIDIGAGTAVNLRDENATSVMPGVEFSDPAAKFTLAPGVNSLRYVESGLVGVNVSVDAWARWE